MRKTYRIFTDGAELCQFINSLTEQRRKFTVTPWSSSDGSETGFVVWYYPERGRVVPF